MFGILLDIPGTDEAPFLGAFPVGTAVGWCRRSAAAWIPGRSGWPKKRPKFWALIKSALRGSVSENDHPPYRITRPIGSPALSDHPPYLYTLVIGSLALAVDTGWT